jgi:GT2 family glycosyltransferase
LNPTLADISVIIPAYNRDGLIRDTLQSILNQTVSAREIVVVDDGSTDDTAETVLEMVKLGESEKLKISRGKPWPEFKVLKQNNAGPGAARNRGLREATGEFIHFFDSDDIAAPNKHEVQLRALLETGADIAYGPWVKGRFFVSTTEDTGNTEEKAALRLGNASSAAFSNPSTSELVRDFEKTSPTRCASGPALAAEPHMADFVPEGAVLQARGLPKGHLVRALLTNWSIVPHACLFRRSILEKVGGFPEDIWVGEDQLLFLRCLLAGAKVVHTPETMVYYRVGNDAGKLTAAGAAQERHARDWGRFLLKAKKEMEDGRSKLEGVPAEAQRRGDFFGGGGWRGLRWTEVVSHGGTASTEGAQGAAQGTCAGASEPDSLASKLADSPFSESPTRSANEPAEAAEPPMTDGGELIADTAGGAKALDSHPQSPATSYPLPVTTAPLAWFGFRLRAYEAWRDLEKFFPDGEGEVKLGLQEIWRRNRFSVFRVQFSGFLLRKLAGLKLRVLGYREHASFRCERPSRRAGQKIEVRPS